MAKITLVPNPTFDAKVPVPVPGSGEVDTVFTFKYRTREEMQKFLAEHKDMDDTQLVMGCASGWELADPFDEKNVKEFASKYIAGPAAVFETYCAEMTGARLKNSGRPRL